MTKEEIIRLLKSYNDVDLCIKMTINKIAELEAEKTRMMAGPGYFCDGMPRGSTTSDPTATRCQEAMRQYDLAITTQKITLQKARDQKQKIEDLLDLLDDLDDSAPRGRNILYLHYCQSKPWETVADKLYYSERQTKRFARSYLEMIEKCPEMSRNVPKCPDT